MHRILGVKNQKSLFSALLSLLVFVNVSQLFTSWPYSWLIIIVSAGLLLLIARSNGLSFDDIGLSKRTVSKGLIWGGIVALIVIFTFIIVFMVDRNAFLDSRYHNSLNKAIFVALIIISLHTVLFEELAFRGVLWSIFRRLKGVKFATIVSSLLFGIWHIVPSLGLDHSSNGISSVIGNSNNAQIIAIIVVVCVTSLTGIGLCELRRRSDSLIAPFLAHWAINGGAVIFAALAWTH